MTFDHERLQALVDDERVQDLLAVVSPEQIVETWLRYHRRQTNDPNDPDWWAVELWMTGGWWADESRVREELLRLIDRADERTLGVVAAGPLEVFIGVWGDDSRLAWIERESKRSEKFRKALTSVQVWELPDRLLPPASRRQRE